MLCNIIVRKWRSIMRNSFDVTRTGFEMIDGCGKAVHEK